MEEKEQHHLIYDKDCTLCDRFKQALERIDSEKQYQFHPIQEEETYQKFSDLDPVECQRDVHLITADGQRLIGEDVVSFLLSETPGVKKFAWLLENDMGQKAISVFHKTTKQLREKLRTRCPGCK